MRTCVYCGERATTLDALGLNACQAHEGEADAYIEGALGRNPNDDTFLYCDQHSDRWQPDCERCEQCCQYHYRMTVQQFLDSPASRQMTVRLFANPQELMAFLTPSRE